MEHTVTVRHGVKEVPDAMGSWRWINWRINWAFNETTNIFENTLLFPQEETH